MAKRKSEQVDDIEQPSAVTDEDAGAEIEAMEDATLEIDADDEDEEDENLGAADWVESLDDKTEAMADAAKRLDAAYEADEWEAAEAAANELIAARPTDPQPEMFLGMVLMGKEDKPAALAAFDRAAELAPNAAEIYVERGRARYAADDTNGAIEDYKHALKVDPKYAPAYMERGYAFFARGGVDAALSDFKNYCKLMPTDPIGFNNQAFVAMWMGRTTAAEQLWRKATSLPDAPHWAYAGHATALWRMKKRKDAVAQYKKAVEAEPRWKSEVGELAGDFSWPQAMVHIAEEIVGRLDE